jgi:hypothetical protein
VALVVQIAGILALAAVVGTLMRTDGRAGPLLPGVVVVIVAVSGLSFWSGIWRQYDGLLDQSRAIPGRSRADIDGAGGAQFGAREGVLAWADRRLPAGARVYLECRGFADCGSAGFRQWLTFRLIPRRFTARPTSADWVLVYGVSPRVERMVRSASASYLPLKRGYGLGRSAR